MTVSEDRIKRLDAIHDAMSGIRDADRILDAEGLSWETKYSMIFKIHSTSVYPNLKYLGVDFTWYNPDGDYDEDCRAYLTSARKLLEDLQIILSALTN